MAMPWSKAKEKMRKIQADPAEQVRLCDLFNQCFRIQREVSEAAGRYVPMVVENVRGAQRWVGKARWNFGSFYLWGDVPALMPIPQKKAAGTKLQGNNSARRWEDRPIARLCDAYKSSGYGSKSIKRKEASALIAKIPTALAQWIARVYKPVHRDEKV